MYWSQSVDKRPEQQGLCKRQEKEPSKRRGSPQKCGEQDIVTQKPDKQRDLTPPSQVGALVPHF